MSASSSATDPESPTDKPSTLVGRLHALAESNPGGTAFFHKERGVWQRTTWRGLSDEVQRVSAGLHGLGFQPGDMTVLVTDPSPPWVVMILAVEALGGTAFAVHETFSDSDLLQILGETRPRFLLASRPEHVTRLRTLPGAPVIEHRMVVDGRALQLDDPGVLTYESLNGPAPAPAVTASTAPLMLSYTGGATGAPKAWALTSGKLLDVGSALLDHIRRLGCDLGRRDRMVADMPTGEIGALVVHVVLPLLCGAVPHFADAPDAVDVAIREVRPTFAVGGRHHWERWVSQVAVDIDSGSRLKRLVFRAASKTLPPAGAGTLRRVAGAPARLIVTKPLLDKFGFSRLRVALVRGAIAHQAARLWAEWGVDLRQAYGLAECPFVGIADQPGGDAILQPLPGAEIRTDGGGQLLVRASWTAEPVGELTDSSANDWYATGDLAEVTADGLFEVRGRVGEICTIGDRTFALAEIEQVVRSSPYVRIAVVVPSENQIDALLELDPAVVGQWARANDIPYMSYRSLLSEPRLDELVREELELINARLSSRQLPTIRSAAAFPKPLESRSGDEITPRHLVRRSALTAKYRGLLLKPTIDAEAPAVAGAGAGAK